MRIIPSECVLTFRGFYALYNIIAKPMAYYGFDLFNVKSRVRNIDQENHHDAIIHNRSSRYT